MALTSGTRFGSYEITAPLGAGGMGEVYRARDTNLKRDVAIKVLPTALASDAERLARFQREAELLAALNHPNIAQIYGLERSDGTTALVMELVSGQNLIERLAHGALPVDEALGVARQIAAALEAAHERGIVHRDLKPANVQLTAEGAVKVLDFGIAKALDTRLSSTGPAALTTPAMTEAGIVLGTAAYMSPEQARGKAVDQRADIWAFGCVLYELLTGRLAFGGDDVTLVLARVLERSPDFEALPKTVPPAVRRTLELCLEKDPKKRIADIRDVTLALAGAFIDTGAAAARAPWWGTRAAVAGLAGVAVLSFGAVAWFMSRPIAAPFPETHLEISTPGTATPTAFAISADGRRVVYSAAEEGRALLWVRSLDGGVSTRLEGTEDAATPFWSPDGRSLGFFRDRALKVIDVGSGAIRELAQAADGRGGSWNGQGDVLFAPTGVGGIWRVSAQGGERVTVTALAPGQRSHGFPAFLPNGRDFVFFADGSEVGGVYAGSLGEAEPKRIIDADGPAAYASGHLIFPRQGRLFAQPFDLDTLSAIGEAVSVTGVAGDDGRNVIAVAASATGVVVYRTEAAGTGGRRLAWFDRSGAEILSVEGGERSGAFALSPDEGRMAIARTASGNSDIWMIDLRRGVSTRFTTAASLETHPVFSADGSRLIYQRFFTDRGVIGVVWRPVSGGEEESLIEGMRSVIPTDMSRDGQFLLLKFGQGAVGARGWDILALPLSGDRTPIPAVVTPFDERDGQFSPDAAWLLYQSDESGQWEVHLQPFGRAGERVQVSVGGGAQARWRADGREIFYVALDGRLMAVSVQPSADVSAAPTLGRPEPLFVTSMGPVVPAISRQWYVPSPDGQRFLMGVVDATSASPLEVILNFNPAERP